MSAPDKLRVMKQTLLLMTSELRKFGVSSDQNVLACLYEAITEIEALQIVQP